MLVVSGLLLAYRQVSVQAVCQSKWVSVLEAHPGCYRAVGWVILFYTWVFGIGLPVGPGALTYIAQ